MSLVASPSVVDGLLARNIRMAMKMAEKAQPDILILAAPSMYQAPGTSLGFRV